MAVAVVFPGQGAQAAGMGAPWRAHPAWEIVGRIAEVADADIEHLLLRADQDELSRTTEAQFAIFAASLVAWEAAGRQVTDVVAMAGHSLGEVTALVAAGALSIEEGARLVAIRTAATQQAADARPGRMVALLGGNLAQAEAACEGTECWVANDNAPGQVVVGGTPEGVATAVRRAQESGVRRLIPLDVGGAFHTPLMEPASAVLARSLADVAFAPPSVLVVHNSDAAPHGDRDWAARLSEHVVSPVRWRETMQVVGELGAQAVVEVGPGSTLTALARRAAPALAVVSISEPSDVCGGATG